MAETVGTTWGARLDRWSRWWWVPFLGVIGVLVWLGTAIEATDPTILELELFGPRFGARDFDGAETSELRQSLWIDFAFIVSYSSTLLLACRRFRHGFHRPQLVGLGVPLGWAGLAAGALDVVENLAIFGLLAGSDEPGAWGWIVAIAAWPKWILAIASTVYALIGLGVWVVRRPARP